MSYQSFAKDEMRRAEIDPITQELVLKLLTITEPMCESGASQQVYTQHIAGVLRRGAVDHLPAELKPVFGGVDIHSEEGKMRVAESVFLLHAFLNFEPITPLTGADDEWNDIGRYNGEEMYQNRRLSTVFKDGKDAQAYRIDQILFAYPNPTYRGWHLINRGNALSSQPVVFPYHPQAEENQSVTRWFSAEDWQHELPQGVMPDAWLRWMSERYRQGVDPTTNKIRKGVMFSTREQATLLETMFRSLLCYVRYSEDSGGAYRTLLDKLEWLEHIEEPFTLKWSEPRNAVDGPEAFQAVFTKPPHGAALMRLLSMMPPDVQVLTSSKDPLGSPLFRDAKGHEYRFCLRTVMTPTHCFQGWEPFGGFFVPVLHHESGDPEPFYTSEGYPVLGDAEDFLYQKRREFGFTHPRGRHTLRIKMADDCLDPVGMAHNLMVEYRSLDNASDNPVGKKD